MYRRPCLFSLLFLLPFLPMVLRPFLPEWKNLPVRFPLLLAAGMVGLQFGSG
jgi:hypothetical protein